jgi:putative PIN family toxin of toxin-antitoxin system
MKVGIDTDVAISGLLWAGPPNQILRWSRDGLLKTIDCESTTAELKRVLRYEKLSERLEASVATWEAVFAYFINLVNYVPTPKIIPEIIAADPFDNVFLVLAQQNGAHLIISGDDHQ